MTLKEAHYWAHLLERTARKYDLWRGGDRQKSWWKGEACPLCKASNRMANTRVPVCCGVCIYRKLGFSSCAATHFHFCLHTQYKARAQWIRKILIPKVYNLVEPDLYPYGQLLTKGMKENP